MVQPFGVPEHHAGAFLLEVKQIELAAELAVVALLGFLDLLQIGVELFLLRKRRAVDARQHRIVAVAAPIGARDLHQLERIADLAGRSHMRAAAEIEPVALEVDLDRLVAGNGVDQFDLEGLALVAEHLLGLLARPDFLGERFVARDDLAHLLFDRGKIFRRERLVAEEVVIEAVLDHGADRDLCARPQRLHGFGEHMRGVMPDQLQRAGIVAVDQLDLRVLRNRIVEIGDHAIQRHRHRALGQRRRDALGEFEPGDVLGIFALGAIGEGEGDFLLGFGRFQIRKADTGIPRRAYSCRRALSSPNAHSCERAQVSGSSGIAGDSALQSGKIKKIGRIRSGIAASPGRSLDQALTMGASHPRC